jgi:BirA family transcriptional regulator, biotin operon repressor / biotin---[acetyl-CoA-carboxylase] ligase
LEEFFFNDTLFGFQVFYSPVCSSTQALALQCAASSGLADPIVLYTFHQTRGRGQGNNSWNSSPGLNLAFTLLLPSKWLDFVLLNKAITLGVRQALETMTSGLVEIKWPNDIFLEGKKVCGLLMENSAGAKPMFIVGVGVNVNQKAFEGLSNATSLVNYAKGEFDLLKVLKNILGSISAYILQSVHNPPSIQNEFDLHLYKKGEWTDFVDANGLKQPLLIRGVDELGRILVEDKEHVIKHLHHGEVRMVK